MGKTTEISWCDHTFNCWIGCSRVSDGCKFCYAETLDKNRFSRTLGDGTAEAPVSHWGKGAPRHRTSEANWREPLKWNREAEKTGTRPRVFCASLADVFDAEAPDEWRVDLMLLINNTPHLDWLLLTKRPENVLPFFERCDYGRRTFEAMGNVWLGTSVENQKAADERIPELLKIPAKVHFLSCEPLLGKLNLCRFLGAKTGNSLRQMPGLEGLSKSSPVVNWVIAGGESGSGARPCRVEWLRDLRAKCEAAKVPFFLKQLGKVADGQGELARDWRGGAKWDEARDMSRLVLKDKKGGAMEEWPADLRVREIPTIGASSI